MSPGALVAGRSGVVALPPRTPLEHGGVLARGRVAFEVVGDPGHPVVAVLGGISAGRHVTASAVDPSPGWWEPLAGPGRALDTTRYRVLGVDFLAGGGDSSPIESFGSGNGRPPRVGTRDQARALAAVLDYLGVERLHALVGSSYGGMAGLAFAAEFGARLDRLVAISASHRPHPMATAVRSVQRQIVRRGLSLGDPDGALALARGLAMTTYRTDREFAHRFDTGPEAGSGPARFPVDAYLAHQGQRYARATRPQAFLALSESLDLHHVPPSTIRTPTTVVSVDSDTLVPRWQLEELYRGLAGPRDWVGISSVYGHDAFLKEVDAVSAAVGSGLAGREVAA